MMQNTPKKKYFPIGLEHYRKALDLNIIESSTFLSLTDSRLKEKRYDTEKNYGKNTFLFKIIAVSSKIVPSKSAFPLADMTTINRSRLSLSNSEAHKMH